MLELNICSQCGYCHHTNKIKNCYTKNIKSSLYVNHLILNNNIHLINSNYDQQICKDYLFWQCQLSDNRFYNIENKWYTWPLIYDIKADFLIANKQNSDHPYDIPLGLAIKYLIIIQNFWRKRIKHFRFKKLIFVILKKPPYIQSSPNVEVNLHTIISYL